MSLCALVWRASSRRLLVATGKWARLLHWVWTRSPASSKGFLNRPRLRPKSSRNKSARRLVQTVYWATLAPCKICAAQAGCPKSKTCLQFGLCWRSKPGCRTSKTRAMKVPALPCAVIKNQDSPDLRRFVRLPAARTKQNTKPMKTTTTPRPKNPQKIHSQRLIQWTGAALAFCFASAVAQAQITNDLVLHLTFDNTYNNTRANGIDGTAVGSPTFVTGQVGSGAVALTILRDASTFNYVTLGNPPLLNFGSVKDGTAVDFSIGFWCNYTNQIDDPPFIANKNWSSSGNQGWGIFTQGGGNFRVNVTDDAGTKQDTTSTPTIRDGKWHHVVVTFARQGVASIYVDGAQVSTSPLSQVVGPIDTSLVVNIGEDGTGAYTDGGSAEMVNVFMDDLGIWRRVISPTEVAAIYNAGLGGTNLAQVPASVNPYVKSTVPGNGDSGVRPNSSLTVVVSDGLNALDTNSVRLLLIGPQVPVP